MNQRLLYQLGQVNLLDLIQRPYQILPSMKIYIILKYYFSYDLKIYYGLQELLPNVLQIFLVEILGKKILSSHLKHHYFAERDEL